MSIREELQKLINRYSRENVSDTPDFILAQFLEDCLRAFEYAVNRRDKWFEPKMEYLEGPDEMHKER